MLVRDGRVVGEGHHRRAGEAHAEVVALERAGARARGATLYVTLEPCAHQGRTPPCVDALIAAGIARVVACHRDPDPRTAGRGFAALEEAGIAVEVGERAAEAIDLNLPFLVSTVFGRPAVTLKWAATLDGRIATAAGESRWITGASARRAALELREEHDAILVGVGTVIADDPLLTRRLHLAEGPILRVVLDRRLRIPSGSRLLAGGGPVLVYTEVAEAAARERFVRSGVEVARLESVGPESVLADLARRGVRSVLVEGGAGAAGAFVDAGLWDRVEVFLAPRLVGGSSALGAIGGRGVDRLLDAAALERARVARRGADFWIRGTNQRCSRALSSSVGV